jgi:UDP-N-acetylmuramate dehydrogenase
MSEASVLQELAGLLGDLARADHPLGARTTYRVGGAAALWVEVEDETTLAVVHRALAAVGQPVPLLVVGKGSNLLVSDGGFEGLALGLGPKFSEVEIADSVVRAGGAAGMPVVARRSAAAGLRGLEWAVGVPGSVGGALRMNAGGHGSDTAGTLSRYRLFDLASGTSAEHVSLDFHPRYRQSSLGPADVVVWAEFTLQPGDAAHAQALVADVVRWRRQHQPGGSNAGSVFTNPADGSAGELIERCGLKGRRLGSAEVSAKHANFIQADEGGSADDVRRLLDLVRAEVAEQTGVWLVPELHMVGFADIPPPTVKAATTGGQASTSTGGRGKAGGP